MHATGGENPKSPPVQIYSLYSRITPPHGEIDSPRKGEVKNKIGLY